MNNKSIVIAVIVIALLALGGFFLLRNQSTQQDTSETPVTQTDNSTNIDETASTENADESTTDETTSESSEAVTLTNSGFSPRTLTVKKGTKVVFKNESGGAATVDSNPHPVHTSYPDLNLGRFEDGSILEFAFDEPGTYGIHNHLNASHQATITVEE